MKALVKAKAEPGLWLEDVPEPEIGINDVLIRVEKTGICGTDLHIYNWDEWAQKTIPVPMVVGHEFVGEIVEVGSNVHDFYPGEIVSGEGHVVCGHCRNCLAGRRHLCAETVGIGVNRTGAFAEYIAIPQTNVWHHEPDIDREVASIFDPLGNAVHTALSFDVLGEDVLITGAGPIGCMATAVVRHAGARFVVVTDVNPWRLELAKQMGATRTINVSQGSQELRVKRQEPERRNPLDSQPSTLNQQPTSHGDQLLKEVQSELGMKEGFDVGLEMSGNASAFRDMLANMCHGGKIAMLGIPSAPIAIDWNTVIFNMLTIKGIYGREMYETWYKMTVMIQGGLDITPVITHRYPYNEFEKGFQVMKSGESGKVILDWSGV
ncbi:MAG: L-threonine 3-dehydrogenase [Planctomycetaceae bacterium]|nr:L-threonine 3-dehydrogenase [Planctomycetaceae bacterium]